MSASSYKSWWLRQTAKGLCVTCCGRKARPGKRMCVECGKIHAGRATRYHFANRPVMLEKLKERNRQRRQRVLDHYGNVCACCGERQPEFLAIDHVNNDGAAHRKKDDVHGGKMYHWLVKNNFPEGFQLLCHNCNLAKGFYGVCPHQKG